MNVSFSTRGWQQIPWEQQVQMAETMRFGGVELYNVCLLYTSDAADE